MYLLRFIAGELLHLCQNLLEDKIHPTVICAGLRSGLEKAVESSESLAFEVNLKSDEQMLKVIETCISTKFTNRFGNLIPELALNAIRTVTLKQQDNFESDIKNYAKVEKLTGGSIEDSHVLKGMTDLRLFNVCKKSLIAMCLSRLITYNRAYLGIS